MTLDTQNEEQNAITLTPQGTNIGKYKILHQADKYSRVGELRVQGNRTLRTPFMWTGLSVIEPVDSQERAFRIARIQGFLSNVYDLLYQDKKGDRRNLCSRLMAQGLFHKDPISTNSIKNGKDSLILYNDIVITRF